MMFLVILWCSLIAASSSEAKRKDDLEIVVEYKPASCSRKARTGDVVSVHYTGMLENGKMFDSSLTEGREPIKFELGRGRVIRGWEEGIKGMCVGEKRKLIIPPHLGYGKQGAANVIPPDSYLIFTTELINIDQKPFLDFKGLAQIITWPALAVILVYYLYKKAKDQVKPKATKEKKEHAKKSKRR
ncbi:FK506-binding protein 2-like [Actinia tenebrosa]|uniref:peptidylprolyl isomerase n=1 Tax=Actinia tenebrosa TaxID=6105 RepID=A0A6P8IFN2_ACTTE|nr:FK506-binding protein 2-like [Actinia tenebrosa]